ncbi:hypothetical protein CLG85_006035 [Yangia mangrovi]|uniref:Uncharacterized protein n=1 Tax=Alloyangia mangrovi TaxID=1779329 RepID=A0A2A3JWL7_9RHOB|nr:hypothetical protein [Alloyangia mangrovi]MCA0942364.1 hypothetical protein [Alloyangia pacifica]MCA0947848.1 hypothetical protein [Alloyangia pacifica]MCT4369915.1 hypothetical protein [Alloyangia mangrovi]
MLQQLVLQSAGAAIGIFLGALIGLGVRKRKGNSEGLLAGSVLLTACAAGGLALVTLTAIRYFAQS